jgi:NAD(P)-dependent dehydrogenase (short-subunit alcohol dehydrogenase family)
VAKKSHPTLVKIRWQQIGRIGKVIVRLNDHFSRSGNLQQNISCYSPLMESRRRKMRLIGKIAVVTGGSRGIGLAISQALSSEGAKVVIASKNPTVGQAAAKSIDGAIFIETDVSNLDQVEHLVSEVMRLFGRVDILVNNAAVHESDSFENESPEIWNRMYSVNVLGTVFPSQAVTKIMKRQGKGRIVHMASKAGVVGEPGHAAYSASKGAIISLTRAMAVELAPFHITVNAVCPGPVETDMLHGVIPNVKEREALAAEAPLGRMGQPEDIVGAVVLFASDEADWITGQALSVDGGFSVLK